MVQARHAPLSRPHCGQGVKFMILRHVVSWLALSLVVAGCAPAQRANQSAGADSAAANDFKIGVMTGTVSQGEEDFRAGQQIQAKYGNRVKHVTYPDNFMNESE